VDAEGKWNMIKVSRRDGTPVNPGDVVTSFRGDDWTFIVVERPPVPGKSARVTVARDADDPFSRRSFYAEVFDLVVTAEDEVAA
jgi:hypothetical protein